MVTYFNHEFVGPEFYSDGEHATHEAAITFSRRAGREIDMSGYAECEKRVGLSE